MKKYLVPLLKICVLIAIIAWLIANIDRDKLQELLESDKSWSLLAVGFCLAMTAICLTFIRWYLLVRALRIEFRLSDAFRLGFLSFLMNFVGVGSVGGDLFKAFSIAHEQPGRRTEAVATVVIDRAIGLYALLILASAAILWHGMSDFAPLVQAICNLTLGATLVGTIMLVIVMIPRFSRGKLVRKLNKIPRIGGVIGRLILAVRVYQRAMGTLAVSVLMSVLVHVIFAMSIYVNARAIGAATPSLADHMIIVPLSLVAGALPITPGGIGTFEAAMTTMYELVPVHGSANGLIVALTYRVMTIAIAAVGALFYMTSRREVNEVLEEAGSAA